MVTVSEDDKQLLREAQSKLFRNLLPLIVILIILGLVGFLGNLLAIIFYFTKTKRTSAVMLIGCLAIADLIVCVLFIPNIVEMSVNVLYTENIPCKLAHFSGLWTIAVSCIILGVIAIDRHRKICSPFGKHIEIHHVKRIVIGIVVFGFCLAFRDFFTFDTAPVEVKVNDDSRNLTGYYCTTRDEKHYEVPVTIFSVLDFLIVLIVLVTLIICYSHIIFTLFKVIKKEKTLVESKPTGLVNIASCTDSHDITEENQLSSIVIQDDKESKATSPEKTVPDEHSVDHDGHSDNDQLENTTKQHGKHSSTKHTNAMSAVEKNLTIMMFVVSVVFTACFIPYFVVKILMRSVLQTGEEFELGLGVQFALRFPYLNSVFNPIIYCYFNPHFRDYVKELLKGLFLVCRRRRMNI
ncbi:hypothetical protein ACF0H5_016748 [Mactra antiquata]